MTIILTGLQKLHHSDDAEGGIKPWLGWPICG